MGNAFEKSVMTLLSWFFFCVAVGATINGNWVAAIFFATAALGWSPDAGRSEQKMMKGENDEGRSAKRLDWVCRACKGV